MLFKTLTQQRRIKKGVIKNKMKVTILKLFDLSK